MMKWITVLKMSCTNECAGIMMLQDSFPIFAANPLDA